MGLFSKIKESVNSAVSTVSNAANTVYHTVADPVSDTYHEAVDGIGSLVGSSALNMYKDLGQLTGESLFAIPSDNSEARQKQIDLLAKKLKSGAIETTKDKLGANTKKKSATFVNGLATTLATSPLGVPGNLTVSGNGKSDLGK